jgi:uncharacterized protein GlcG (DUF336 family)
MADRRRSGLAIESLERREMLAITSSVVAGSLTVTSDAASDTIAVTCVAGNVRINGADPDTGAATCASLSQISIAGGGGNDTIDLSGVTVDDFLSAADPVPLGVTADGGSGDDLIRGSQFGDILTGGGGLDTIIGGSGLDQRNQPAPAPCGTSPVLPVAPPNRDIVDPTIADPFLQNDNSTETLSASEVQQLLCRAAAATLSSNAIIAIVDRNGHILGVRVESAVVGPSAATQIAPGDTATLVFAIDGAVAKARTAAFFANQNTPLTSRTIRSLSQTTVLEREVNSNPNVTDPNSPLRGPGTVAAIGRGGHFPPEVKFTPQVDLYDIEHTNRDSIRHPGPDRIKGTADDIFLSNRFNLDPAFVPAGQEIEAPESYGFQSGLLPTAQSRGIATLPGGIPIYKPGPQGIQVVGGIGVFFPGPNGYASFEQGFVPGVGQSALKRQNAPRALEAEYIAFAAVGGTIDAPRAALDAAAPLPATIVPLGPVLRNPDARIDLVGITLEIIGPNPRGIRNLDQFGKQLFKSNGKTIGSPSDGTNQPIHPSGALLAAGEVVPQGTISFLPGGDIVLDNYLVTPHDSPLPGGPTAQEVEAIIKQAVAEASKVRAAIRLPRNQRTSMVVSVTDNAGNVLGLFRMPDSTIFSIEVAVSKARNVAYYASTDLVLADRVDDNDDGVPDLPVGTAFTNRTFRFLALPFFPEGQNGTRPGDFNICRGLETSIDCKTGENIGAALPASAFQTVMGFHAFNPGTNFRDPTDIALQSGIIFFPGSSPLYRAGTLLGGYGISGDGVDQDDVVTDAGARLIGACAATVPKPAGVSPFQAPGPIRADQFHVRRVRLPYIKFLRNPCG